MADPHPSYDRAPGSTMLRKDLRRYLGRDERLLYSCQCHQIVLVLPFGIWFAAGILSLSVPGLQEPIPGTIVRGVVVAATVFLAFKLADWRMRRYLLTNTRVLLVEGVFSQRVRALPLRMVIDTTYSRTFWGRLFGYGNLELNLSGQPALRTLRMLPHPDVVYRWIVSLTGGGAPPPLEPAE